MAILTSGTGLGILDTRIEHSILIPRHMLTIGAASLSSPVEWRLPPSKSHLIRWLAIASQSSQETILSFDGEPGADAVSMSKCIGAMGSEVSGHEDGWSVRGVIGASMHPVALQCGNSGTTANFLTAITACLEGTATLDGDPSLRSRHSAELCSTLEQMGCSIDSERLPRQVSGDILCYDVEHDWSRTSQGLSALMVASPGFSEELRVSLLGESVSSGYWMLTKEICVSCGSKMIIRDGHAILPPWEVEIPERVEIPVEESLQPIAMLLSRLHGVKFETGFVDTGIGINETIRAIEDGEGDVDLGEASDIISPVAAIMAIGDGGRIRGIAHTRGKETDRISKTVEVLNCFDLSLQEIGDELHIPGGQRPRKPKSPVETHSDHRLAMTAMALASKCGGVVCEPEICSVSDPGFIPRLLGLGD